MRNLRKSEKGDNLIIRSRSEEYRLRIAYFSPLPPDRSGIADYSLELLPHLSQYADITIYTAQPEKVNHELRDGFEMRGLESVAEDRGQHDVALYQMGNSVYHNAFFPLLTQYPGVVVLHDYYIHHFIAHRTMGTENFSAYARELGYAFGKEGMHLAQDIRLGFKEMPVYNLALNNRILDVSLGLLVHSEYVAEKVRQDGFRLPVQIVPQIMEPQSGHSRRHELGLDSNNLIFASYGLLTTAKQIEFALRAFKRLLQTVPNAHYLLVGEAMSDANPESVIQELGLDGVVHCTGYVTELSSFVDWIQTADVVINLRYPTVGETSATALRAMAAGRPVIVFDHGWYGELPDGAAVKIAPMDQEELFAAMIELASSSDLRRQIGQTAQHYIEKTCHPTVVAEAYITALHHTLNHYYKHYE